jgi:hypothetical protein
MLKANFLSHPPIDWRSLSSHHPRWMKAMEGMARIPATLPTAEAMDMMPIMESMIRSSRIR